MSEIQLDVMPFLQKVAEELRRIDPTKVKALADAIHECYEHRRTTRRSAAGVSAPLWKRPRAFAPTSSNRKPIGAATVTER